MSSSSLSPGRRLGCYEILSPIGAGGMGEVYRARDTKLERDVAVKVLPKLLAQDPRAQARFEREARALAALSHPNILAIFDFGRQRDISYAVTELLEGETLRSRMERGPLPLRKALDFGLQMAQGLAGAHEKGVFHRDLKPENLFVTKDGRIKVFDFGLAKVRAPEEAQQVDSDSPTLARETIPGTVMGTVGYMSPEQVRGQEVDHRTDIFSLGAILYEMLSGRRAFQGDSGVETMNAILKEDPREIPRERKVPPSLTRIVRRCLEKSAEERFDTARDLAFALSDFRDMEPAGGTGPSVGREESAERSIAILPFANMSPDPENEYFSDGMSEEIINALTQLEGLRVAARTSSFSFKGKSVDITEVGAKLKVETVLEGSVRKAGNRLRITAQLISVADGYHLWSERYDREMDDVFAIQDEIATAIAERLKVALVGERDQPLVKPSTQNLEAYQLYLEGRFFWNRRELRRGLDCFENALALDPDYALAYAGVADAYGLLGFSGVIRPGEAMPKAREAVERALELDDTLAEAHYSLAYVSCVYDWDWPTAAREFERAIELNPSYAAAHYMYAFYLWLVEGRTDEAIAEANRAVEIDPLDSHATGMLGIVLWGGGRSREAIPLLERAVEQDPAYFFLYRCLGLAYHAESMHPEAIAALEQATILSGRDYIVRTELAIARALSGEPQKAETILNELIARSRQEYVSPLFLAVIQLALGRKEEALASLERAYDKRDPTLVTLKHWPFVQPLHGDPRFESLLKRIGWK